MRETGLLRAILPELEKGVGLVQNRHHDFDVFEHTLQIRARTVGVGSFVNKQIAGKASCIRLPGELGVGFGVDAGENIV